MPVIPAARKLPALKPGEFRFVAKAMSIEGAPEDQPEQRRRRFHTIASSTVKDLGGDEMKLSALNDMAESFRQGRNIFMNHSYEVPRDVFGRSDQAEIVNTGLTDPKSGQPIWDLHIYGNVNEPNPIAAQLADSMEGGYVVFGTSIGAIVREHTRNKSGGKDIIHVDCMEGSIVGIPMNQRSWTQKAATAAQRLDDAGPAPEDDDEDENPAGAVTAAQEATVAVALSGESVVEATAPEIDTTKAGCPDCGKGRAAEGCSNDYHTGDTDNDGDDPAHGNDPDMDGKSAETVLDADLTTKATTTDGQEADPAATPETASESDEDATPDPADGQKVAALDADVVELAHKAVRLAELINARDEVIAALRDEVATLKAENVRLTSENAEAGQVIERVMRLPLRRKAVEEVDVLDKRLPNWLSPEVKALLNTAGDKA